MRWPAVFLLVGVLGMVPTPLAEPPPDVVRIDLVQQDILLSEFDGYEVRLDILNTVLEAGWGHDGYLCMLRIAEKESGLDAGARGDQGDSYGLWQRHAPSWGVPPEVWTVPEQTLWALDYAVGRYGSPCGAWQVWQTRAAERGGNGWW